MEASIPPINGSPKGPQTQNLSPESKQPRDSSSPPSQGFVDMVNRFGFRLQNLIATVDKPNGLCAINIYQCLMMAAAGSQKTNLKAFGMVLGFKDSELDQTMKIILQLDRYCKTCRAAEYTSASSAWYNPNFAVEKNWTKTLENSFKATFGPLEIASINHFVETATRGKIKDFVSEPDLQNVVLMLTTCLFFKGLWEEPFQKSATRNASFHKFNNEVQTCDMMCRVANMDYMEDDNAHVCILPFKADPVPSQPSSVSTSSLSPRWKTAIILPKEHGFSPLKNLISIYSNPDNSIRSLLSSFSSQRQKRVNLSIPRFTLKLGLRLNDPLKSLGLTPIFEASTDFAPISNSGPLYVSLVTHDIFIEVNEEGAEMAAASSVRITRSRPPVATEMRVDRPFLFLIFDDVTKLVLSSSVVSDVEIKG